jgi:hypothetical protein
MFSGLNYRGQLGEGTEGPRGRGRGVVASRGRVRDGCGVKVAVGGRLRCATRQRALILAFLPVDVSGNLIAINQMDPYDSDSSDGGPGFPRTHSLQRSQL